MTDRPKAILEQIFNGDIAKVLDHFTIMKPFDYSLKELSEILELKETRLVHILHHLKEYDLVKTTKTKTGTKFKLSENSRTLQLNKFMFEVATWNIDNIIKENKK